MIPTTYLASSTDKSVDYIDGEEYNMMTSLQSQPSGIMTDAQGLIVPKKLVNPCLESHSHQSLHRELMFNQKM